MKKSNIVFTTLLTGGVLYSVLHHNPVYRDLYANREETVTGPPATQLPTGARACLRSLRRMGA